MITLNEDVCTDLEAASRREWLESNGIGGYASSTVSGINTRRYHGLLVAATDPPVGRMVLLSKFEEVLRVNGSTFELSANRYPDTVHPEGFRYLKGFRLDPYPVWTFEVEGTVLERRLFMPHGRNAVACSWEVLSQDNGDQVSLELRPLVAFRDHHHLGTESRVFEGSYQAVGGRAVFRPSGHGPALFFNADGARVESTGFIYRNFEYGVEKKRGFDFSEDLFQPFSLGFDLSSRAELIISSDEGEFGSWTELENAEVKRRAELVARLSSDDETVRQLALAADQFIVRRGGGYTIIAGYPWFSDWGRDTMIALPGLTLSTGRYEIARDILLEFADHVSEGMLPNRFPDDGEEPEYNTVDAALWYVEAVRAYIERTGDLETASALYPALSEIIDRHVRGTRYGIGLDDDGLLGSGAAGVQLTWMDARVGDVVVTPRHGKPVEIQALWYNALRTMEDLAEKLGKADDSKRFAGLASKAKQAFGKKFWNADKDCLFDVVAEEGPDRSIRPNQIFAVSIHHTMLSKEKARKVVARVEAELLTPFGLRSLGRFEPGYAGRYEGGPAERDAVYHQGTVWAWLLGPFVEAFRRVNPKSTKADEMLEAIKEHLGDAGLNQISEIFDGDPPHEPRGCFAQAWSVAELLRVLRN